MNEEMKQLRSRRVDWLCWYLTKVLVDKVLHTQHVKQVGFKRNAAMEALVTASVRAAAEISDACVKVSEGEDAPAFVRSSADDSVEYSVCGAGTAEASCTCVYFQRGNLCKHIIKVYMKPGHQEFLCHQCCNVAGLYTLLMISRLTPSCSLTPNALLMHNAQQQL